MKSCSVAVANSSQCILLEACLDWPNLTLPYAVVTNKAHAVTGYSWTQIHDDSRSCKVTLTTMTMNSAKIDNGKRRNDSENKNVIN